MKICRFNSNRIGIVADQMVTDVTELFETRFEWPAAGGDPVIRQIAERLDELATARQKKNSVPLASVRLDSPVATPGKIIGAPVNYRAHLEEANAQQAINHGNIQTSIDRMGLFQKSRSSLIGPSEEVRLSFPNRRNDHEVELAVVIGRGGRFISSSRALEHVLGYAIGLDMTVRGSEFPGFRKSVDTYAVLGPWIVTRDEIPDPGALDLSIHVNGQLRQKSNTSYLIFDVPRLIEVASEFFTLEPGDVIMTGTPEGVSQVYPGDVMEAEIERIGKMKISIARAWAEPGARRDV